MKTAALSIGNSNLSAALVDGAEVLEKRSVPVRSLDEWPGLIDWIKEAGCPAAAVSVNPGAAASLEERFPDKLWIVGRDVPIPIENRTCSPEQAGHDRLLTGWAGSRIFGPPLLVVDFGTAFTFNVIDGSGAFTGGAIAPGLGLAIRALGRGCAQLPEVERPSGTIPLRGLDTGSAIRSGLFNGYLGLVESLVHGLLEESEQGCRTVATGGDADFFLSRTSLFSLHDPDLLLKGVALAFQASRDSDG